MQRVGYESLAFSAPDGRSCRETIDRRHANFKQHAVVGIGAGLVSCSLSENSRCSSLPRRPEDRPNVNFAANNERVVVDEKACVKSNSKALPTRIDDIRCGRVQWFVPRFSRTVEHPSLCIGGIRAGQQTN